MKDATQTSRFTALINLLDDPNEAIYSQVKGELLSLKSDSDILQMQNVFNSTNNDVLQHRIAEVLDVLKLEKLARDVSNWQENDRDNLLEGLYHIAEYGFPSFDRNEILEITEEIITKIENQISGKSTKEVVQTLNQVILYDYGFSGNLNDYDSLNNSFINRVVKNKKSNPIGLSVIYLLVAKALKLPIVGINSPGHFILGVSSADSKTISSIKDLDFFVDPFNNGKTIDKYAFINWLKENKFPSNQMGELIADNKAIIKRVFYNLIHALYTKGEKRTAEKLLDLIETIN